MMLAFLIDQVQERCCRVFRAARAAFNTRISLQANMRASLIAADMEGWGDLMHWLLPRMFPRPPPEAV